MAKTFDVRAACAQIENQKDKRVIGTGFLIDGKYAATAAHLVNAAEKVTLKFALASYQATVAAVDNINDVAVLLINKSVEDILPLKIGFDVAIGDPAQIYGFPYFLEGSGTFLEGRIEDTALKIGDEGTEKILFAPSGILSDERTRGISGSPVIIGDSVVGVVTTSYNGPLNATELLFATKIRDVLSLLPQLIHERLRPSRPPHLVRGESRGKPNIVVITALEEELDYLYELPFEWGKPKVQKDGISYRRGYFAEGNDIIATSPRSMGLIATAITTAKALKEWNPSYAIMIGVCGGRKEKGVNIGDVIAASHCFHYQYGAFEEGKISRELRVENVESQIIDIVEYLSRRTSALLNIQQSLPRGFKKPNTLLQCHVGPMASADLVVKDVEKMGEAIDADRKTIAVDMESYAFMRAARLANTRWAFVIKSASDFADARKDDEYREYAKYTSAQFFNLVLEALISGLSET